MNGWWESAPLVSPAADPSFTGYIPGNPKPKEPKAPVFVPQGATQVFDPNTGTYAPVPQSASEKDALKEAIASLGTDELLSSITRANSQLGTGWATGTWGAIAEMKPGGGTPRDNFLGNLTAIKGSLIQDKLAALKEASKTGASGMGALSEKEGELLASSVSALTPDMSQEEYEKSFREIAKHAKTLQAIRDGKDPRDPTVQKDLQAQIDALFVPPPATPPPSAGGDTPPGISELSDDQKKAYSAFIASHNGKPDAAAVKTFLEGMLGKQVPNADEIAKALAEGRGASTTARDIAYEQKVRQRIDHENKLGVGDKPADTLAVQGATLNLSDEAAGVGNALSNVIMSPLPSVNLDPGGAYRLGRDAERQRIEDARQQLGYGGSAIEFLGAAASANPSAALATLTPKAAAVAAGKASAVGGALSGYGAGDGLQQSVTGAGVGALAGYGIGRYGPAVVERALPKRFRTPLGMAPDVADAAKAENVDLIRPMVDPQSIGDYGALESNQYSQPIIRGGAARVRGQIEDRVADLGRGGTALDELSLGEAAQSAARRDHATLKATRTRLYDRAGDFAKAEGDPDIVASKAIAATDVQITQLQRLPGQNANEIAFLEGLKADLSQPGLKLQDIRDMRTGLRSRITGDLLGTKAEARASEILNVARDDIEAVVSPKTANAYRRADTFETQRRDYVRNVIEKFIGTDRRPVTPGTAMTRLKALASPRGDGKRLAAFYRRLDRDEQADVAASFADYAGRPAEDAPFSTAYFLKQTSKYSPSAQRTIFGPAGEQSIKNLRLLSRKLEEAEKDINRSRSASTLERQGWRTLARSVVGALAGIGGTAASGNFTTGVASGVAGAAAASAAMAMSGARRILSARAMVNPRVSRWLGEAASVSSAPMAKEATRKLSVIIAREPALAHELQPVYDFLENRLALPLAAQSDQGTQANNE